MIGRALAIAVALGGVAFANGRPEGTKSIDFRPGHPSDIWVGLTFGAIVSHDGGATWHWTCEDAVGYAGEYDPDYVYTASGKVFATAMHTGLVVNTDGCTFGPTPFGTSYATTAELAPNGDVFVGFDDATEGKIYRSTDDGVTFPQSAMPGIVGDNWNSLAVAPSDPARLYLAGYRYVADLTGHPGNVRQEILFRSDTAGVSFVPLSVAGIVVVGSDSVFEIAGVSRTDPDVVFLRVTPVRAGLLGDAIYRSVDAGATWAQVLALDDALPAFVARANGDVVAGTMRSGSFVAHDCGKTGACTFTPLVDPPHVNCLVENAAGEVWACTQNIGGIAQPSDGFGIMKSTDLATWTPVLRYQDIAGPIACPDGTVQATMCTKCEEMTDAGVRSCWCSVRTQIAITADPTSCPVTAGEAPIGKPPGGCCDTGGGVGTLVLSTIAGAMLVLRRRR